MIQALCNFYAWSVAVVWSGAGYEMLSFGNVVFCADANTALRVEYGCLSVRAVMLTCVAGIAFSIMLKRAFPFFAAIALGMAMSWFRVFLLVGLALSGSRCFHRLHSVGAYPVFLVSVVCLLLVVYYAQRFQGKGLLQ